MATRSKDTQTSAMDSKTLNGYKRLFLRVARSVCPEFTVDEHHREVIRDIFAWCMMMPGPYNPRKGLWLCGSIGTGKSTMLLIIKEFCKLVRPSENGWPYSYKIIRATELCKEFAQRGYEGLEQYVESNRLAIDEVGAENLSVAHYGMTENVIQYILQHRYDRRHQAFTHVSTNLTEENLRQMYGDRIYDRCRELFNIVPFTGPSHRGS